MTGAEQADRMEQIYEPFVERIVEYQRRVSDLGIVPEQPEELQLFPWQLEAVEELRDNIRRGVKNQILASPTGSGKTICAAYLIQECHRLRKRALFVIDRISLLAQTSALFDRYGIPHGVIQAQHWRARPWERIQIASAQTLRARGRWPKDLDLLVQDECFSGDVEILTERGFTRFDQLSEDLRVAQFREGEIDFVKPLRYIRRHYDGPMVRMYSDRLCDLDLTPNHEVLLFRPSGRHVKVAAAEATFNNANSMYVAGKASAESAGGLTPYERLMVALQADGNIHHAGAAHTTLAFSFVKERKVRALQEIADAGDFELREVRDAGKRRRFMVKAGVDATKDLWDQFDITEIGHAKAAALIEEMVEWDGHRCANGTSLYFSSVVESSVDFYQSVAILAGYKTLKGIQRDERSATFSDVHRLWISPAVRSITTQRLRRETRDFSGNVYCVSVPSGNIVVRRGGKPLVVGNCHGRNAYVDARIQQRAGVCIGLSATPTTRGLGKLYDAVVTVRTTDQLIADGYLAPYDIYAATEPDMTGAKVTAGEWSDREAEKRAMPIIGDAVAEYLKHAPGKKFIAFGCTVAHCEEMQRHFMAAGVVCGLYTYRQGDEARAELLRDFSAPDAPMRGLISVAALARGFDAPDVECIIMARPLRTSFAEHVQIFGRGIRRDPANPAKRCLILDHSGNCMRFAGQMVEFFANGITELDDGKTKPKKAAAKKEPAMRRCPTCAHVHLPAPSCPMCGTEYPKKKPPVHLPGELTKLSLGSWQAAPRTATMQDKQAVYSQLLAIAQARRYKSGWVSHKYRAVFGVWPRGMDAVEAQPTPEVLAWVRAQQVQYRQQQGGSARQPHWRE